MLSKNEVFMEVFIWSSAMMRGAPPAPPVGRWTGRDPGLWLFFAAVKEHSIHKTHYNSEHTNHLNQHLEAQQQTAQRFDLAMASISAQTQKPRSAADGRGLWLARRVLCGLDVEASVWLNASGPNPENLHVYAFHLF